MGWSRGWAKNRGKPSERNVVVVIPGKDPKQVVVMADHYDTAYMEDLYGKDQLRAAAHGADDNHSATTALLLAADVLLPLAREGKLEKTVWLVHLTGEEFPADCLGARALARSLVRGDLALTQADGTPVDVSGAKVVGGYVLDMIGHNNENDRDVFQNRPGRRRGFGPARADRPRGQRTLESVGGGLEQGARAQGPGPLEADRGPEAGTAGGRAPGAAGRDPHRVGAAQRALQHRRADLLGPGHPSGAVHGELRHPPHRLPRHQRHHEEHRPRLLRGAGGHHHRGGGEAGDPPALSPHRAATT
ncbi:MAG: M28 family peptidase [Myxococcales bacterium]